MDQLVWEIAELLAQVPNVRAVNVYFDDPGVTLQQAMPTLKRLQAGGTPLILAKDVYMVAGADEEVRLRIRLDGKTVSASDAGADVTVFEGTTVTMAGSATDDGLPEAPGQLGYVIVGLPSGGFLEATPRIQNIPAPKFPVRIRFDVTIISHPVEITKNIEISPG